MHKKIPIVVLAGGGSKLPAIIKASKNPKSLFKVSLVVSHKNQSPGIALALQNKIPGVFFNLPDYRKRIFKGQEKARSSYSKTLGWFISQKEYAPKLLVFVGWDLIMDNNFFDFFKSKIGNGYAAINLHPALMPMGKEKNNISLPDGSEIPVIKGEQQLVLETVLKEKHTYFGPSVHFMNPKKFDTGTVIIRQSIKVGKAKTVADLRKKLMPIEDKILITAINQTAKKL
jgi:folate-dependent phosphoribosylglycinamide formyltransferase PurN